MTGERMRGVLGLVGLAVALTACAAGAPAQAPALQVSSPTPVGPQPALAPAASGPTTAAVAPAPVEAVVLSDEPARPVSPVSVNPAAFDLLVLHTNDVRGYVLPCG